MNVQNAADQSLMMQMVSKSWDVSFLIKKKSVFYVWGHNQYSVDFKKRSIHAEVDAMNKLKYSQKTKKVIIIVFRINNAGTKLLMAKPCPNCLNYMKMSLKTKNYKIRKAYYTDNNGVFQKFII